MTRRWGSIGAAVAILAATLPGCSIPSETLGPNNHVKVTNLVGHFQLTADNIQNVTTELTFSWQNPGVYAVIEHRSFTPHGTTELIIKDAAGSVMYDGKLLEEDDERDDQTLSGIPGEWTVIFSLDQSVARIDVTLDAAWPPD